MRAQRKKAKKVPAIHAFADALPFDDHAFDASMSMIYNLVNGIESMANIERCLITHVL